METQLVSHTPSPCYFSRLLPSPSFSALNVIKLREPVGLSLKHDELLKITVLYNCCVCNHKCYKRVENYDTLFSFCFLLVFFFIPFALWKVRHKGPIFFTKLSPVFILIFPNSYESVQTPLPTKTKQVFQLKMKALLVY